ncbi:MAG: type II toxin-antitoxin system RelE/ParE family toxin [Clostridia bacterium]|nr:type II toxin-antitoxin system RelE/ParE family toxin [Clostridia bacterium]
MRDTYEVRLTRQAIEQLGEIRRYITDELFAPEAANRLMDTMQIEIGKLRTMPDRVPLTEEEPWRTEGIRRKIVENFIVYFWIDERAEKVHVTAVVYARRDQLRILSQMEIE